MRDSTFAGGLQFVLAPAEDHPLDAALAAGAERAAAHGASAAERSARDLPGRPALVLAREGCGSIRYLAAPEGPEEAPFLEALAQPPDDGLRARLAALAAPAEVQVFIAAACPHCPHVVRAAVAVSLASSLVTTTIIDAFHYPELAQQHAVRSVPLTVLDGGLSVTGALDAEALAGHLLARGTEDYEARAFASLIEGSRFDEASAAIRAGPGLRPFLALWRASALSERMGLMIVAEQVLEEAPDGLHAAVGDLCAIAQAEGSDASLRGDTADLLGKIGHADAIPVLETLTSDANPDVAEIAAEVLEELRA